jgi:hypothetical protein
MFFIINFYNLITSAQFLLRIIGRRKILPGARSKPASKAIRHAIARNEEHVFQLLVLTEFFVILERYVY